jgi:hypothetical protein
MLNKTHRYYLRYKIYKQEKKIKKLWKYQPPNKLFIVVRYRGIAPIGYWKGRHYRNGQMFTEHPHKSCMFNNEQSAQWALKNSELVYESSPLKYKVVRIK